MSKVIQGIPLATLLLDEDDERIPFDVTLRIVENETDHAEQDETGKDIRAGPTNLSLQPIAQCSKECFMVP